MLAESRSGGQYIVIAPQRWMFGASDGDVEIAIEHMPELDVSESKLVSREEGVSRKLLLGDVETLTK